MQIVKREIESVTILDVKGEIDLYNAPEIRDEINRLIEADRVRLIINLDDVSYIDSSGIGALISGLSNLKKKNGGLKIINVNGSVRKVFELTKLTTFFEIHNTEQAALAAFN